MAALKFERSSTPRRSPLRRDPIPASPPPRRVPVGVVPPVPARRMRAGPLPARLFRSLIGSNTVASRRPRPLLCLRPSTALLFAPRQPPVCCADPTTRSLPASITRRAFSLTSQPNSPPRRAAALDMDSKTHDTRSKRKQPPTPSTDRPSKQHRPKRGAQPQPGDQAAAMNGANGSQPNGMDVDYDSDDMRSVTHIGASGDTIEWQHTIEKVVKNVVSIHFCQTAAFDTDSALASEATGFVVDAERGYILTNRVSNSHSDSQGSVNTIAACRRRRPLLGIRHLRQPRRGMLHKAGDLRQRLIVC